MSAQSESNPRPSDPTGGAPAAVLVARIHDGESTYAMFELRALSVEGAFLAGALWLELNEDLEVELAAGNEVPVRVRARVVRLERGDAPGMEVAFSSPSDSDRRRIERMAAAAAGLSGR